MLIIIKKPEATNKSHTGSKKKILIKLIKITDKKIHMAATVAESIVCRKLFFNERFNTIDCSFSISL